METLKTIEGKLAPVSLPNYPNKWIYSTFFISDLFSPEKTCGRCNKTITYVYVVGHQEFGTAHVGMECIREVLDDNALKPAMNEFKVAAAKINQSRFKSRISRIKLRIPKGILEVLQVQTRKGPILAKQALDHLEDKLQLRIFLSSHEIEILQKLEQKL